MTKNIYAILLTLLFTSPLCLAKPLKTGDTTRGHQIITQQNRDAVKQLTPQQAVVMDPNIIFQITNCAMGAHTDYAWTESINGHWRFVVGWPKHRHV